MKIIAVGEFLIDLIDHKQQYRTIEPGGSSWNILYRLSSFQDNCYAVGFAGDDEYGHIALKQYTNIDTTHSFLLDNYKTKYVHYLLDGKVECPNHGQARSNEGSDRVVEILEKVVDKDSICVLDELNQHSSKYMKNINQLGGMIALDLGFLGRIEDISRDEITEFEKANIIYLQINRKVVNKVLEVFNVKSIQELIKNSNIQLAVITNGSGDMEVLTTTYSGMHPVNSVELVNDVGAGDAFFASMVDCCINGIDIHQAVNISSLFAVNVLNKKVGR